ncbi:hypothetical protein ABMY26_36415 (plasmid) [Azospirillum sp. HJ39]|uniref:hypothetical protein n=1 Tax=Azospirillum sp. HJ39 TaxID=3159496 RepID=UPI003556E525
MTVHQVAIAAGVHWTAAARVLRPDGEPSLSVARKIERLVPRDFVGPVVPGSPDMLLPAPSPVSGGRSMGDEVQHIGQSASGMPKICMRENISSCSINTRGSDHDQAP